MRILLYTIISLATLPPVPTLALMSTLPIITRDMRVLDIVTLVPQAADVMAQWGLHCSQCSVGGTEILEDGCRAHGLSEEDIDALLVDIDDARQSMPARPGHLTLTASAARAIRALAEQDGKTPDDTWWKTGGLTVTVDGEGGFCMEFSNAKEENDRIFIHADEPQVRLFASPLTLGRIGGATIDFRDGRFKLDLFEDASVCDCSPTTCNCEKPLKVEA